MTEATPVLSLTERAAARVKTLLSQNAGDALGLRIGVRKMGCSDMSYTMDFAKAVAEGDLVISAHGATVVVDPAAEPFIRGTELDWVDEKLSSRFVFRNPNEVGRCGCGESFKVG